MSGQSFSTCSPKQHGRADRQLLINPALASRRHGGRPTTRATTQSDETAFVAGSQDWRRLRGALYPFHRLCRYFDPWMVVGIEISLGDGPNTGGRQNRSISGASRANREFLIERVSKLPTREQLAR
jgi:hypothetical protein